MKAFYHSTYYFWIVTKSIFAIAALISGVGLLNAKGLTASELLWNFMGVLYSVLLVVDVVCSLNGSYYRNLKYTTGTMSIILGFVIFMVTVNREVISVPVALLFVLWILLLGVFDLLQIGERKVEEEEYEE